MGTDEGFFSRWSRRKAQVREVTAADPAPWEPGPPEPASAQRPPPGPALPPAPAVDEALPTLDDLARLPADADDFSRFVAPKVPGEVRNAAMKKLFSDPRFNVMDGLDVYIDDYGKPDPLPAEMLRRMVQSRSLGLFAPAPDGAEVAPPGVGAAAHEPPSAARTDDAAFDGAGPAADAAGGPAAALPVAALPVGAAEPAGGSPDARAGGASKGAPR